MTEAMDIEDIPPDLIAAAVEAWRTAERTAPYVPARVTDEDMLRDVVATVLPLYRQQIANAIERHAQSIGWYEGGGVWAEAIEVARNGYQDEEGEPDGLEQG